MAAQKNFPQIEKKTEAYKYKYATLDQILGLIREPLADEGVVIIQPSVIDSENGISLQRTILLHCESGESIVSELKLSDEGGPQDRGSEISYMRRYTLLNACGIFPVDEDTDGKEAQEFSKKRAPKNKKAPRRSKEEPVQGVSISEKAATNYTVASGIHVTIGTFAKDCETIDDLTLFWKKNKDELTKLNETNPEMYEKALAVFSERKAEILSAD